jgi:peroxiredoxin
VIKPGDALPAGKLKEFLETAQAECPAGPNEFNVADIARGKKLVIFGLPGAFTPTCSARHVPGYLENFGQLKAKGVDEVWCVAVNDAWVMGAWGRDQKTAGKIRMLADGGGDFTKALGLEVTIPAMGLRSQRYSMLVDNGIVKSINLEAPGKFEVSGADAMVKALG